MTDPTLRDEIDAARQEIISLTNRMHDVEAHLESIRAADRLREWALRRLSSDWDHLKDRLHYLANRFLILQERQLVVIEGPPPPASVSTSPPPEGT